MMMLGLFRVSPHWPLASLSWPAWPPEPYCVAIFCSTRHPIRCSGFIKQQQYSLQEFAKRSSSNCSSIHWWTADLRRSSQGSIAACARASVLVLNTIKKVHFQISCLFAFSNEFPFLSSPPFHKTPSPSMPLTNPSTNSLSTASSL
jgi:hypothetical protein